MAPSEQSLDEQQPADEQRQPPGLRQHQAEVDRHADRDEEEAEQQALERRDVGSSVCRYSELASSTPARKAPSAIDSPAALINCAIPITSSRANAVKISRTSALAIEPHQRAA